MTSEPPASPHRPVLPEEVLAGLALQPTDTVVDATVGLGGHSALIAPQLAPEGRLIAIDRDQSSLDFARARLAGFPATFLQGTFADIEFLLQSINTPQVNALLADLGVSSPQLDLPNRGFSFRRDGPLDMRMDTSAGTTAAELVADLSERELAWIFKEYGEERLSQKVARRIVAERARRPITSTTQLADLIRSVVPRSGSIDPATRVFQALRIATNDELGALDRLLAALPNIIKPGGRVAIVSFHSLEDRKVKHAFRDLSLWKTITRSPITAKDDEMADNPRSRSAKLRVAQRLAD